MSTVSENPKKTLKIDIVSDNVCPWCFIGKRRMEKALDKLPKDCKVEITWKPFQLNSKAPVPGVSKIEKYRNGGFESALPYWTQQGKKVGINFSYGGNVGNTFDSHRLIAYAKQQGKQDEMVEKIMSYYFEQEKDISVREVLEKAAKEAGVQNTKEFLESKKLCKKISDELLEGRRMGVSSVPCFILNDEHMISGAWEAKDWEKALKKMGYL
mmetsp:Transcript_14116/g.21438  ORF Transcript_14116/g.21438 Transcript_14116/m.21438 type:complete len:212 (-) Transcript_14116:136-771(-)|eukprot:CAMPEP_0167741892 /NCGR_PEP_ID=MMETSP0110_2-20121227/1112_1 /TAXON_ID=629695 /ORGANISM="Gymnochlora sp., Strain CCMP2014" /LENGTH=211 /DNA_ID=CAMNT_0007626001 /DNA_START=83 /DNA_END=718 /DNA_ORIENTATION=+